VQKREAHWARLEALVAACRGRDVGTLSTSELRELAQLYRQTAADLATAREDPSSRRLAAYLNQLLGRAHNLVYAGRPHARGDATLQTAIFIARAAERGVLGDLGRQHREARVVHRRRFGR
jgi:hypothetical protein